MARKKTATRKAAKSRLSSRRLDSRLREAVRFGELDDVKSALDAGANVNAADREGKTALMEALQMADDPEIARFYQQFGAFAITTNRPGWLREQLQLRRRDR